MSKHLDTPVTTSCLTFPLLLFIQNPNILRVFVETVQSSRNALVARVIADKGLEYLQQLGGINDQFMAPAQGPARCHEYVIVPSHAGR